MAATYFSPDYSTARSRFGQSVERAGGRLASLALAAEGPAGEVLTIDVGWFGAAQPSRVLVHSSGIHGVEAFAGSAVQLRWLDEGLPELPADCAIALVHVLNPYGMAWLRRCNEHNVDLNRNFLDPGTLYEGAPDGYESLDSFLNPPSPPAAWDLFYPRAAGLILRYGTATLRQVVAGGQYVNPRGLFYGGARLEEGPRMLAGHMQEHLTRVERLVVVDVHSGLGPFGIDTLLVPGDDEAPLVLTMRNAFGDRVSMMDPASGPAYRVKGAYDRMYGWASPAAALYFVGQEFGTYRAVRVVRALRAENRWHHYGEGGVDHPTKTALKEIFSPGSPAWRAAVLHRGRSVIGQALGLMTAQL